MVISSFVKGTWNVNHSSKCKVHACIIISNFFAYILDMTPLNHTIIYDLVTFGLVSFHICLSHFATFSLSTQIDCMFAPHKFTWTLMWVNMGPLVTIFRNPQPAVKLIFCMSELTCAITSGTRLKEVRGQSSEGVQTIVTDDQMTSLWMDCFTCWAQGCTYVMRILRTTKKWNLLYNRPRCPLGSKRLGKLLPTQKYSGPSWTVRSSSAAATSSASWLTEGDSSRRSFYHIQVWNPSLNGTLRKAQRSHVTRREQKVQHSLVVQRRERESGRPQVSKVASSWHVK